MYKTKKAAQAEGKRVRKMLGTKIRINNVKLEVFENIGWNWCLTHKHFGIYPANDKGHCFCLMNPNGYGTGRSSWTKDNTTMRDPYKLLKSILRIAKREVRELQDCIDEVEVLEK